VRRRTLAEKAHFFSADEAALALGMHQRALKRRVQSGAITPPAKYVDENRYLWTADELDRARQELGIGKPLAIIEQARELAASNAEALARIGALHPDLDIASSTLKAFEAIGAQFNATDAFREQFEAQDRIARHLAEIGQLPGGALRESVLRRVTDLDAAVNRANRFSTSKWIADMERTARWMGDIERRAARTDVPDGQVAAFPQEESLPPATLDDVLAELRVATGLLRALLDQSRAANNSSSTD
jgi:hypothetical protein